MPDKGMNFPHPDLQLSPVTDKDRQDLDFVAAHADIVGYWFVQTADDIKLLQQELTFPELIVQAAGHSTRNCLLPKP